MKLEKKFRPATMFLILFFKIGFAYGWADQTHLMISKAAGYSAWYNSAGADITKTKAGMKEEANHYSNLPQDKKASADEVFAQIGRYDQYKDPEGHLWGAIIASIRYYQKEMEKNSGRYGGYHLAFCAHYIGDLSQPLHNTPYSEFNKQHHLANDLVLEEEIMANPEKISARMYEIKLNPKNFEKSLASEIARIANLSRDLGKRLEKENRDMTKEEAYIQLGHSASLIKAVLTTLK
jgi:hypothetical protein